MWCSKARTYASPRILLGNLAWAIHADAHAQPRWPQAITHPPSQPALVSTTTSQRSFDNVTSPFAPKKNPRSAARPPFSVLTTSRARQGCLAALTTATTGPSHHLVSVPPAGAASGALPASPTQPCVQGPRNERRCIHLKSVHSTCCIPFLGWHPPCRSPMHG